MQHAESEPCPVCGTTMEGYLDVSGGVVFEDVRECPAGCYGREFVTGSERTRVGNRRWISHGEMPVAESCRIDAEIRAAITEARAILLR